MIRHLSRDHAVTVATLLRGPADRAALPELEAQVARVVAPAIAPAAAGARMLLALPTLLPSSFGYFASAALATALKRLGRAEPFDLAIAHSSSMGPYIEAFRDLPKIIDFCDMDSEKWRVYARDKAFPFSLGYALEGWKVARAERRLAAAFDCATCATPAELESLRAIAPGARGDWFPNGVDLDYFKPAFDPEGSAEGSYDPDRIAFVGRMDYYPNERAARHFAEEILPRIRAKRPGAHFTIVGAGPRPALQALDARDDVTVTGRVPDVRPFLTAAACTVVPLEIARGTQNKILESLALGVPVVASGQAARGLDARPDEDLLVAEGPADWAEAVLSLQENAERRRRLALAGRARMEAHHSWPGALSRLERIIDDTLKCRHDG